MTDFNFHEHLERQRNFSEKTFGPGMRTAGIVKHIRKELEEILAHPTKLEEWIDVVILGLDGAWRTGANPEQIITTLVFKQTKNEGRDWPDWRTIPQDEAIEHTNREVNEYYVHRNSGGSIFVKEAEVFEAQGGLIHAWGKAWRKITAVSVEQAREIGERILPREHNHDERISFLEARHQELLERNNELLEQKRQAEASVRERDFTIKVLRRQITEKDRALHKKNIALDAMHYVWCDGACELGIHRYDGQGISALTEEIIDVAINNTNRLVKKFRNTEWQSLYQKLTPEEKNIVGEAWNKRRAAEAKEHSLREAIAKDNHEIEQILGKALHYPWYKNDQKSFPGATEQDGVCVGEHVALSLVDEAAAKISESHNLIALLINSLATWYPGGRSALERCALYKRAQDFLEGTGAKVSRQEQQS